MLMMIIIISSSSVIIIIIIIVIISSSSCRNLRRSKPPSCRPALQSPSLTFWGTPHGPRNSSPSKSRRSVPKTKEIQAAFVPTGLAAHGPLPRGPIPQGALRGHPYLSISLSRSLSPLSLSLYIYIYIYMYIYIYICIYPAIVIICYYCYQ